MKKARFIDLVCLRLGELGVSDSEIAKQRSHINRYLTGLGIGEESKDLDYESPEGFADEIFEIIKAHENEIKVNNTQNKNNDVEVTVTEIEDEDIKVFPSKAEKEERDSSEVKIYGTESSVPEENIYESLGNELESEISENYAEDDLTEPDATREFNLSDLIDEDDSSEDSEEDEEIIITGNPVFFWIFTVILSPIWISLFAISAVLSVAFYVLLSVFIILYIPLLIALILGGSVAILAELIYSIIKIVTGQLHIGLFELGLGFVIAALTICLSVLIYRFGTKYSTGLWKRYWHIIAGLIKTVKRFIRRIKGVCSI